MAQSGLSGTILAAWTSIPDESVSGIWRDHLWQLQPAQIKPLPADESTHGVPPTVEWTFQDGS